LLCVVALLYALTSLATPLVYKVIFDELIPHYSQGLLIGLCAVIVLICILSITFNSLNYKLLIAIRTDFPRDVRLKAMDAFMDYPYAFYLKHAPGRLIALVGADMEKLAELVWNMLRLMVSGIQLVILLGFVGVFLELRVFFLFLGVIALYFCWSLGFRKLSLHYGEQSLSLRDDLYKHCYDIFPKIREIKCYGLYDVRLRQLRALSERERKLAAKTTLFESLLALGASLPVRIAMIIIFIFGYFGIAAGEYTPGYIITILVYAGTIIHPIIIFLNSFADCYFSWHIRTKIRPFLEFAREPDRGRALCRLEQGIAVRGLRFSYPYARVKERTESSSRKKTVVLDDITLQIPAGSVCTFVGTSGAGKTTLISLLVRLYNPPRGSIFLDGKDIRSLRPGSLRRLIGVVTQEPYILNETLRVNIDPDGELSDREIREICSQVSLDTLLGQLPAGLDTIMFEGGMNLSGGERQRVVLARRLARGNRVMILDEATSALDLSTETEIIDTIMRLRENKGITFIGISHRPQLARRSDRIFVLEQGRMVEQGSHAELLKYGTRYHALYGKPAEPRPEQAVKA
jgi:ATP-binding cassette subfamily B protein